MACRNKFMFPMDFLKTNDVVVLGEPSEVIVFLYLENCGEVGDPTSPLVIQVVRRRPSSGVWTHEFLFNRARCVSGG